MTKPERKRFIAGAVCPQCHLPDKIYLLGEAEESVRCCNHCGFEERLADVSETSMLTADSDVQPIKIALPNPPHESE